MVLKSIDDEESLQGKNQLEIAKIVQQLSEIRKNELDDVKHKRIYLNGLVEESKQVLERFDRSIEAR